MIKIMIADDHQVLLDGLTALFEGSSEVQVVATAPNGKVVLEKLADLEVDIVLLDINMPEMNGVETCRQIMRKHPDVKVIAISMYKQSSYVKRMKSYGARGYILKDDSAEEMIEAIQKVHEGNEYYSSQLMELLRTNVLRGQDEINPNITDREKQVLQLISEGFSNKEICAKLFLSVHTVDSHRKKLLSKYNAKNTAELVKKAMDQGIV